MHPGLPGTSEGIVGAGASGAVFGLAGLLIVLLKSKLLPLPEDELKRLRRSVIWFAVLNFVLGAGTWVAHTSIQIDNFAHLGGFLTGLALAMPMLPKIGVRAERFRWRCCCWPSGCTRFTSRRSPNCEGGNAVLFWEYRYLGNNHVHGKGFRYHENCFA
jgi:rhomboid protease GluP